MNYQPSLPELHYLPMNLAIDVAAGYCFGKITRVNVHMTMIIFAIRCIANTLTFAISNGISVNFVHTHNDPNRELNAQKIFVWTSFTVNTVFIFSLKELQLIGRLMTTVLTFALFCSIAGRLRYIETQENPPIQ